MNNCRIDRLSTFFVALLVVVSVTFVGCTTEGSGDDEPREKYLGVWQVSDQPARLNYEVVIENNPANSTEIILKNFADFGGNAAGLVVGNSIIIEKQTVINGYHVEGTGTYIRSSELRFEYELDDGIDLEKRKGIFTK